MATLIVLAGLAGLAACAEALAPDDTVVTAEASIGDLLQVVTVYPASPRVRDTLLFHSVIRNTGDTAVTAEILGCTLLFHTDLTLRDGYDRNCGGMRLGDLAPGDSVWEWDRQIVVAGSGKTIVSVRHLWQPELWVDVEVVVR